MRGAAVGLPASGRKLKGALRTLAAKPLQGANYYPYSRSSSSGNTHSEDTAVGTGAGGSSTNKSSHSIGGGRNGMRRPRERSLSSQTSPVLLPVHLPPLLQAPPPSSSEQLCSDAQSAGTGTTTVPLPLPPPAATPAAAASVDVPAAAGSSNSLEKEACGPDGTSERPPKQEEEEVGEATVPDTVSVAKTIAVTANLSRVSPAATDARVAVDSSSGEAGGDDDDDDALVWEAYEAAVAIRIVWRKHLGHVRDDHQK